MLASHFLASLPLLILLICSLVFYGKGLVHIMTLSYALTLAVIVVGANWELMFFPLVIGTGAIAIILFIYSMSHGNWL